MNRKSLRLKTFDYFTNGAYFITVCTHNRENCFGKIENEKIILNETGKLVEFSWKSIPLNFKNVLLDEFIVMPNHIHGIIFMFNEQLVPGLTHAESRS